MGRLLSHLTELGSEQRGIDSPCPLERFGVDEDIDERIEASHCGPTAHLRSLNAQRFGLTVDAFSTGALAIDALVEGSIPIQCDAHQPAGLNVDDFDAAFAECLLLMLATLACGLGEEQGATGALSAVALGMLELIGRLHAQADRTTGHAIGVADKSGMGVLVEGDSSDAATESTGLIRLPGRDSRHRP